MLPSPQLIGNCTWATFPFPIYRDFPELTVSLQFIDVYEIISSLLSIEQGTAKLSGHLKGAKNNSGILQMPLSLSLILNTRDDDIA